ncbi:hypothetical protein [Cylindrospermopsis raciborskii]|uniref:hypothetical protein n=1 Tax=Cylindrospermopsis raciborskii TaxID=77022 RepID=UPI0011AF5022|nr:hypothetical protein [Cylindrospermopsis raciborskii]
MNMETGDREALPTGDRIQCSPDSFSREKFEHGDGRSLLEVIPRFLLKGKLEHTEGQSHCTPDGRSLLVIIPRFLLKGKLEHTEGRSRSTPYGISHYILNGRLRSTP